MPKLKQSVCWWCFSAFDIAPQQLMQEIAAIGYHGVELLPPALFQLAKDHGLEVITIQGHTPLEDGLNKLENGNHIEAQIEERLAWAQQWQIPNLIVFSGNRDGLDDARGMNHTIINLQRIVPLAEQAGVTLLLELLNSKVDHPDFMCDSTAWAVEICRQIESPNLKILYDIYHMQVMEGNVISTIKTYHEYIAHYHTAGVPGRAEVDETQELNYAAIMRAIAQTGYTGYIGQEFVPRGEPIPALQQAYQICTL